MCCHFANDDIAYTCECRYEGDVLVLEAFERANDALFSL